LSFVDVSAVFKSSNHKEIIGYEFRGLKWES
jgi:hypothetical protein